MSNKLVVAGLLFASLLAPTTKAVDPQQQTYLLAQTFALRHKPNGINGALQLLMDARLTPSVQKELWGTGDWSLAFSPESIPFKEFSSLLPGNAKLEIRDKDGRFVAERNLERPMAKLREWTQAQSGTRNFLLTVDYSAGWGSYNGPITSLLQISNAAFHDVEASNVNTGQKEPIQVMRSLKSEWKIETGEKCEEILYFTCRPKWDDPGLINDPVFVLNYTRYTFGGVRWLEYERHEKGFWESGEGFPPRSAFP